MLTQPANISEILLNWYNINKRDLPWRETKDPYFIWVSEIILQQTRVNQGLSYYFKFTEAFPDVTSLAESDPEKVMKIWQGLGYYNRAINMITAAKMVKTRFNGSFPNNYDSLLSLKGIGKYTAAAIASISGNEPAATVDGNVIRVLSRLFGINNTNSKEFDSKIHKKANEILSKENPGDHNQAIMEFGALHCVPTNPSCSECILKELCFAFQHNRVSEYPPKKVKVKKKTRYFHFLVVSCKQQTYVQKRGKNNIWPDLYQFPMVETENKSNQKAVLKMFESLLSIPIEKLAISKLSGGFHHLLTHQIIKGEFYLLELSPEVRLPDTIFLKINKKDIKKLAFPKPLISFIEKYKMD